MIAPLAPGPGDRPFGLASNPLGEDLPCRIIRYAYRKRRPPHQRCDFYLFRGRPGTTVMALTVNPNAGVGAPDTFPTKVSYAFRFDTNPIFAKSRLQGPVRRARHDDSGEHRHVSDLRLSGAPPEQTR